MKHSRAAGFTLIEMLTVVVIVGVILAIGIPVMKSLTRATALQGATRQVSNTTRLARQFAITHRVRTEVRVNTNTWNAISVFTNNWPVDKWSYIPVGTILYSNSVRSVVFRPTGDADISSPQKITVREGIFDPKTKIWIGLNSNIAVVTISPILGRVTITP